MKRLSYFHNQKGSSLLEGALLLAILFPTFILFTYVTLKYQAFIKIRSILDQQVGAIGDASTNFNLQEFVDSLSRVLLQNAYPAKNFIIQSDVVELDIDPRSGEATGNYRLKESIGIGELSVENGGFVSLPTVVATVKNNYVSNHGINLFSNVHSHIGILESAGKFSNLAHFLLIRSLSIPDQPYVDFMKFLGVTPEVRYVELLPIRTKAGIE